jgi:hypothetical protein
MGGMGLCPRWHRCDMRACEEVEVMTKLAGRRGNMCVHVKFGSIWASPLGFEVRTME